MSLINGSVAAFQNGMGLLANADTATASSSVVPLPGSVTTAMLAAPTNVGPTTVPNAIPFRTPVVTYNNKGQITSSSTIDTDTNLILTHPVTIVQMQELATTVDACEGMAINGGAQHTTFTGKCTVVTGPVNPQQIELYRIALDPAVRAVSARLVYTAVDPGPGVTTLGSVFNENYSGFDYDGGGVWARRIKIDSPFLLLRGTCLAAATSIDVINLSGPGEISIAMANPPTSVTMHIAVTLELTPTD